MTDRNYSKKTNSPFRYAGGKFYARKLILNCIPQHNKYCEPFVGGGSIFFAKEEVKKNILNDLDNDLINCYNIIKDDLDNLLKKLDGIPAKKNFMLIIKMNISPVALKI